MKKTKTGDVAAPKANAASQQPPDIDWSKEAATGFEQVQRSDLGVPFLAMCQDLSPEYKRSDPRHAEKKIEGIVPGCIFNNLSREIYFHPGGEPISFIPASYETSYVEWSPRDKGGGFIRAHKNPAILNETTRDAKNNDLLKNGNLVVTTGYFQGIVLRNGERIPCVIGMTKTGLRKARFWLNLAQGIKFPKGDGTYTPPFYSHIYSLSTIIEVKNQNSYYNWNVAIKEQVRDVALIGEARDIAKQVAKGGMKMLAQPHPDESPGGGSDAPSFA